MRMWLAAVCLLACTACPSLSSLDGFPMPRETRESGKSFRVVHQPKDERNLDQDIAAALRRRGLKVETDASAETDYVVSYVDRWYWDMRVYLIDLRIDIRDAKTNQLVASARSYQSSLSAMGETHANVVDRTVIVLLDGPKSPAASAQRASR